MQIECNKSAPTAQAGRTEREEARRTKD